MSSSRNPKDGHEKDWQLSEKMWQIGCRRKKRELTRRENTQFRQPGGSHMAFTADARLQPHTSHLANIPLEETGRWSGLYSGLLLSLQLPIQCRKTHTHTHNTHHIPSKPSKSSLAVRPPNSQRCQVVRMLGWMITHVRACTGGGRSWTPRHRLPWFLWERSQTRSSRSSFSFVQLCSWRFSLSGGGESEVT